MCLRLNVKLPLVYKTRACRLEAGRILFCMIPSLSEKNKSFIKNF